MVRAKSTDTLRDVALIACAHAALCVVVRALGFDHVSDDDFARVTIAQTFAHAPKLDPSGTSWLPFPFWLLGSAMAVVGRSLDVARVLSIAFASLAAATPYLALRSVGVTRGPALLGSAFAFGSPWAIWLGASTVPESFCASLTAAGVVGLGARTDDGPRMWPAWALAAACLSRYEVWPAAAVVAIALALRALRGQTRRSLLVGAAICAAAPLLWMAWNAHAHDGPLHFFRRVSTYKRAIGDGATDPLAALTLYPRLLLTTRPEITAPALLLLFAALRDPATRRRWATPLACVLAQLVFLSYGNLRDGAAAHHPLRALEGPLFLLALFVANAGYPILADAIGHRAVRARIIVGCIAVLWLASILRDAQNVPGRSSDEDRQPQIARGATLRRDNAQALVVTPCAFEHFALIAAFGAPERVAIEPAASATSDAACPRVVNP